MTGVVIRGMFIFLDQRRKEFESWKRTWDDNDSFPLSEGLKNHVETFAEDYDRSVTRSSPLQDPSLSDRMLTHPKLPPLAAGPVGPIQNHLVPVSAVRECSCGVL